MRLDAWQAANPDHDLSRLVLLDYAPPLAEEGSEWPLTVAQWRHDLGVEVVVLDTVNRMFGAADESRTEDMGRFVRALDIIRDASGCVLGVHHPGVVATDRMRGSSTLFAAADFVLAATRSKDAMEVTITNAFAWGGKAKDSAEMERPVDLGTHMSLVPELIDAVTDTRPGPQMPTGTMAEIVAHLRTCGATTPAKALTTNAITASVPGRTDIKRGALDHLVRLGQVIQSSGPNRSKNYHLADLPT